MGTPPALIRDLDQVGVHVDDLWDLVHTRDSYKAAVPVLIDWLANLEARVPEPDRRGEEEGLVRALTVREARPAAARVLIDRFRRPGLSPGTGWEIGNALSVVADDSVFDDLYDLAQDRRYGSDRQMIVEGLGRSKNPRAVPLLISLISDKDITAHAISALGKLKARQAVPAIEPLLDDPRPLVRREAQNALRRLTA